MRNKKAFTLAEILITLALVGAIAAMTIPSLVNNINNATNVAQLKKTFATLQQAYNLIVLDAGGSILSDSNFNSATGDPATDRNAMNAFATKLNVVKNCGSSTGCWYTSSLKYLGGSISQENLDSYWNNNYGKAVLATGTIMLVDIFNTNCTTTPGTTPTGSPLHNSICGTIVVDINGTLGPNQYGRDFFQFWIAKTGIYPKGTFSDGVSCNLNSSDWTTSQGCAAKVLTEGAMNY